MENNKLRIRKIDVLGLIQTLNELYDKGVDYVDLFGELADGRDTVNLVFCKEYMNEEYEDNFEMFKQEQIASRVDIKLSDEDLDQLI